MAGNMVSRSINIYVQSGEAEKAYDRLVNKEKQLRAELEKATDPKTIARLNGELKKLEEPLDRAKKKISGELSPSLKELGQVVTKLNNEMKNLSKEDPGYAKKLVQLQQARVAYQEQAKAVQGLQQQHDSFFSSFGHLTKEFAAGLGLFSLASKGIESVIEFGKGIIEETNEAEQANTRLKNILDNLGRIDVYERLQKSAENLGETFKAIKPDEVTNVFTQLVTYGKLSENQINQLTPVIIDFARKSGLSLEESAATIIKSLEGNGKALKEYGINVKDGSTVTERFGIIMTQLKSRVDGAEKAFEATNRGGWETFKIKIQEIQEGIGSFITSLGGLEEKQLQSAVTAKQEATSAQTLIDRYELLSNKTKQTAADKTELQNITATLAATFGNSVVEINKETGALQLNVEATKAIIKQKLLLANNKAAEVAAKYNQALEEQKEATAQLAISQTNYNLKVKEYGTTFDDIIKKQQAGHRITSEFLPDDSKLTAAEKQIITLGDQVHKYTGDQIAATNAAKKYTEQLEELGFKASDVDKLFNPGDPNKPINSGADDPNTNKAKYEDALQALEAFNKKIRDLQQQSEDASKTKNEKEIADARHKYDEIFIEFEKLQKKIAGSGLKLGINKDDLKDLEDSEIAGIIARQQKEIQDKNAKDFIASAENEYQEAIRLTAAYYEEKKQLEAQRFVDGEIDQKQYQSNIAAIDVIAQQAQLANAQDYANQKIEIDGKEVAVVKQADDDLTRFKKDNLAKQTADMIAEYSKREQLTKLLYDLERKSELNHAQAQVSLAREGSEERYNAQKNLLTVQHNQEKKELERQRDEELKAAGDNADAKKKINDNYLQLISDANALFRKNEEELDRQHTLGKIDDWIQAAQAGVTFLQALSDGQAQRESAELQRSQQITDKKKKQYEDLYNKGAISRKEYDRKIAELDKQQEDRNKAASLKQFRRQQVIAISSALINGAQAVTSTLAAVPGPLDIGSLGAARLLQIGFAIATTAAQIATISKQKSPQLEKGGAFLEGPSHADGGMPILDPRTGQKVAEIEGGEVILSKRTVANNRSLVSGLLHNSMYRNGASLEPIWKTRPVQYINYSAVQQSLNRVRYFADGGVIGPAPAQQAAADQQNTEFMMAIIQDLTITVSGLKQTLDSGIRASVPLSEIQDQAARMEAIRKSAGGT